MSAAIRVERFAVIELPSVELLDLATDAVEQFRAEFGPATLLGLGCSGNAYASVQCVKPTDDSGEFAAVLVANPRGLLSLLEAVNGLPVSLDRRRFRTLLTDAIAEFQ